MLSYTTNKKVYDISSSTTPLTAGYEIPFKYFDSSYIKCYVTDSAEQSEVTEFTVDESATTPVVLFNSGYTFPTGSLKLTIIRQVTIEQLMDLRNGDQIDAEDLEESLDLITGMLQELNEKIERSMQIPVSENNTLNIPAVESRYGMLLGFDDNGDLVGILTSDIEQKLSEALAAEENAITQAKNAASSASSAASSASQAATSASNAKSYAASVNPENIVHITETFTYFLNNLVGSLSDSRNIAGIHNSIYRGKQIGTSITDAMLTAIAAGTFDDMFIGDYITYGGRNYRIAAFDYLYNTGDTACANHHVVLVPDTSIETNAMNDLDSSGANYVTGGYVGCELRAESLQAGTTYTVINALVPSGHLMSYRDHMTTGIAAAGWNDACIELMSEEMVYGGLHWGRYNPSDGWPPEKYTILNSQLPLFRFRPDLIGNRQTYWLRNIVNSAYFAYVGSNGISTCTNASIVIGVRPFFCVY